MSTATQAELRDLNHVATQVMELAAPDTEAYKEALYYKQLVEAQLTMCQANPLYVARLTIAPGTHLTPKAVMGRLELALKMLGVNHE